LFEAIKDRPDRVCPSERVGFGRHLPEILDVCFGKDDGFDRRIGDHFVFSKLRHEL